MEYVGVEKLCNHIDADNLEYFIDIGSGRVNYLVGLQIYQMSKNQLELKLYHKDIWME